MSAFNIIKGVVNYMLNPPTSKQTVNKMWETAYRYNNIKKIDKLSPYNKRLAEYVNKAYNEKQGDIPFKDDYLRIYIDEEYKKIVFAFRGTVLNMNDLRHDLTIALGSFQSPRILNDDLMEKLIKEYPDYQFVACGHSLGSVIAMYNASLYDIEIIGFNPGSSPLQDAKCSNCKFYIIRGDPISTSVITTYNNKDIYNSLINPKQVKIDEIRLYLFLMFIKELKIKKHVFTHTLYLIKIDNLKLLCR
jgi:hypothetical protein